MRIIFINPLLLITLKSSAQNYFTLIPTPKYKTGVSITRDDLPGRIGLLPGFIKPTGNF